MSSNLLPLAGSLDELMNRPSSLERVAAPAQKALEAAGGRLVLVGAGPFGLDAARACRKAGLQPVAFADNNAKRQGTEIAGLPVMSPADAVKQFGGSVVYLISVFTSWSLWEQMRGLGVEPISFARLCWSFPEVLFPYYSVDNPAILAESAPAIREAFGNWADEVSRQEFIAQIRWRTSLEPEVLGGQLPPSQTLFAPDLIKFSPDESFVDCGAFDGDTLQTYIERSGGKFDHYSAFEPDEVNFGKLQALAKSLPPEQSSRIHLFPNALGSTTGRIRFDSTGTVASTGGSGDAWVEVETLDRTVAPFAPSFIKMDIEGAEPEALAGGAGIIRKHKPILAICLYHATRHLWDIPNYLKQLAPDYDLYLRRYSNDCWELVCYAIPAHRRVAT
jgi:FkbM family methyltransferase